MFHLTLTLWLTYMKRRSLKKIAERFLSMSFLKRTLNFTISKAFDMSIMQQKISLLFLRKYLMVSMTTQEHIKVEHFAW